MTIDKDLETLGGAVGAADATHLLREYKAGASFFFASPRGTMLARGVDATVPKIACSVRRSALAEWVGEFFDNALRFGRRSPVVVGAVPFAENLPAHLVLPGEVVRGRPLTTTTSHGVGRADANQVYAVRQVPEPQEYERIVSRVLRRVDSGELSNVALARSLELASDTPIDVPALLRNLASAHPGEYTFAVDLPRRGEDGTRDSFGPQPELTRTVVGASPDLLVAQRGKQVRCRPVAGARPRVADPAADRCRGTALLSSDRDRREHAAVVDATVEALRPLCKNLRVPREPSVVRTATLWHLASEIVGELRDSEVSSLQLAAAMHPTHGTPSDAARAVIAENEPFERGYYAGMVGWCDSAGDGEWVATRHCAEVEDDSLRLFADADIVAGSEPADELAETSAKLRTTLEALGLGPAD